MEPPLATVIPVPVWIVPVKTPFEPEQLTTFVSMTVEELFLLVSVTETGDVRPHVNVFVGTESVRFLDGLATELPDGATLTIVPAVSGG